MARWNFSRFRRRLSAADDLFIGEILDVAGHDDDFRVMPFLDDLDQLQAVHFRHVDAGDHHIDALLM